jgi:hypothetical protein
VALPVARAWAVDAPPPPAPSVLLAPGPKPLGRLEQESFDDARGSLGLQIDPNPEGKTIGKIYVVNEEVFSRRDWWFQFFNHFHRTTRPKILQRELLFKEGQPYDQAKIDESVRNLQAPPTLTLATRASFIPPELSSVVAIEPIASPVPGMVDILAVTRDVWSLRFNTNFEFQENTLSRLDTSLSENNLLGWRKYLAVNFQLDLGKYAIGPTYFDPNIVGTRLQLYASAFAYYNRDTNAYEGNGETVSVRYPLFSLASRWGAGIDFAHQDAVIRQFQGTSLAPEPLPSMPDVFIPYIFRRRFNIVDPSVTRSFGSVVIQRVSAGYRYDDRRSQLADLSEYGMATPVQLAEFLNTYAPTTETRSEPYLRYEMFTAWYTVYRDLDTFDLRENARLGPSLSMRVAYGAPALGASFRAIPLGAAAAWAFAPFGGFFRATVTGGMRLRDGEAIDQTVQAQAYLASPMLWRFMRLVLSAEADGVRHDTARTRYFLGGDTGLRGYVIGEFQGPTMYVAHLELRTAPLAIFSQRFGTLLFCDVGDAGPSFNALGAQVDVGTGLRWLIPQLNASVIRVDWAVPLVNGTVTPAGFPGRISAGFQQIF